MDWRPILMIGAAYLIGSIPFGLIVGRLKGVDVRLAGSGNIGATNVARLLGMRFFFLVFLLDMLKGLVPVVVAGVMLRGRPADAPVFLVWVTVGAAAILGHMYSFFLGFRGGKGVATSAGVIFGIWPYFTLPMLAAAAVWIVLFKTFRYVSLASVAAAAAFPVAFVAFGVINGWPILGEMWPMLLFSALVAALVLLRHRENLARLRAGTEPRFTRRA